MRWSVKGFLWRLPVEEIDEAIEATERFLQKKPEAANSPGNLWRYFCGVCWRKIEQAGSE